MTTTTSTPSHVVVPAERAVRTVLVGAGGMGVPWAERLAAHPEVDLVGWVDLDRRRLASAAESVGLSGVELGESVTAVVNATGADLVVDVTVPEAHRAVTEEALGLGVAVLGEKPMSVSMADAAAMVAAAEQTGGLFVVSQTRRHHPHLRGLRQSLPQLGRVGLIDAGFYLAPRFGGFRDSMPHPLLLDMSIHAMDTARFLHSAPPVAVICDAFNPSWSWYAGAAAATAVFEMADGARFTWRGCWCAEGQPTSWNAEWRVVGERGSVTWDGESRVGLAVRDRQGASEVEIEAEGEPEGVDGVLGEMLLAMRTGQAPPNECHDNLLTLAMVHAAVLAADQQRRVEIAEVLST